LKSRSKRGKSVAHKDPVTPDTRAAVMLRDKGCVAAAVGMPGECGSQWGPGKPVTIELDHVNGFGLGKRGPSIEENLVWLCGYHHRIKTESSKKWRAALNEYLEGFYGI
jgi:hypothetical protein